MSIIINPGSGPLSEGTREQAIKNAKRWHDEMEENGVHDVEMFPLEYDGAGRWEFGFRHSVTGRIKVLSIHGLTDEQRDGYMFPPRVYWDGSSSSDPSVEDFLADGYRIAIVKDERIVA